MRKSEEETKAINSERSARFIQTRLTAAQLSEAESCFDRLAPKYSLTEAVDYFLKHFHAPDFTIGVSEASTKFRAAMEGVTSETILGCADSTVNRSSDTNRVGPLSLAQWNDRDFLFSPLGSGNSQLSEPVDARLVSDAPLI